MKKEKYDLLPKVIQKKCVSNVDIFSNEVTYIIPEKQYVKLMQKYVESEKGLHNLIEDNKRRLFSLTKMHDKIIFNNKNGDFQTINFRIAKVKNTINSC